MTDLAYFPGRYDGRVALVTGAAQGIGAATARRFAAEGARVAAVDLDADSCADTVAAVQAAGGTAIAIGADVSKRADVEAAVARTAEELGGLHVLVNNAGVVRDNLLHKMTDDDWATVLAVHLTGAFLCCQAAQAIMVPQRYGRIVNLSSIAGDGNRGQANYSAAKSGIRGFTRTLAIELGGFGVTANVVAPGFVSTAMTRSTAERMKMPFEEFQQSYANAIAVKRVGEPEQIAAAITFLASEEAWYISGQCLYVDGGGRV